MLFVFDCIHVSLHDDREQLGLPDNDKGASPDLREQNLNGLHVACV